jgi:hypothetical protein
MFPDFVQLRRVERVLRQPSGEVIGIAELDDENASMVDCGVRCDRLGASGSGFGWSGTASGSTGSISFR